jgi:hypothetical protein
MFLVIRNGVRPRTSWVRGCRARRHGRAGVAPAGMGVWASRLQEAPPGCAGVAPAGMGVWASRLQEAPPGCAGIAPAGMACGRRACRKRRLGARASRRRHGRVGRRACRKRRHGPRGRPARMQQCDTLRERGYMVFEKLFRSSPRRRASPCLAEGLQPDSKRRIPDDSISRKV